jgi:probable rRNA maturation factor
MRLRLYISNHQKKIEITNETKKLVRAAIKNTLVYEKFGRNCEVSLTFVDNEEIRKLNESQRGIDRATDVLSFPIFDDDFDDGEYCVLGDIVISAERAAEQAVEFGHSNEREIAFLTVHSVLHLLGYDHENSKEEEADMFARQEEILKKMNLTR